MDNANPWMTTQCASCGHNIRTRGTQLPAHCPACGERLVPTAEPVSVDDLVRGYLAGPGRVARFASVDWGQVDRADIPATAANVYRRAVARPRSGD